MSRATTTRPQLRPRYPGALLATPALLMLTFGVHAQTLDYGGLEQLFGEPITTSVTGSPQRASEVPANMEIITAEEIRRSGASTLPEILRHVAGIDVLQWTANDADVGVRGYDQAFSPGMLVLVDGRQVYADHDGYTPWSALPVELSAIRQIEVIKGANAALFGFNAVYGVINIVTYDPLYDDINTGSLTGGTQHFAQGSAVTTLKVDETAGLRLSGSRRSDDDFSTPIPASVPGATAAHRPADRTAVDVDGVTQIGSNARLDIEASYTKADQNDISPLYTLSYEQFRTSSVKAQFEADTDFGLLQATAYRNAIDQKSTPGLAGQAVDFRNRDTIARLQDAFKLGKNHVFHISAEYRHNAVNTTPTTGATVFYNDTAVDGMWDWSIGQALSLTNAMRLDHLELGRDGFLPADYPFTNSDWDRTRNEFVYNSGLVWKPADADTLRLTTGRGVLLPNLSILGGFLVTTPFFNNSGSPMLEPAQVTTYEGGWDHALPALRASFSASAFHDRENHALSAFGGFNMTSGVAFFGPSNVGDSSSNGLEIEVKGTLPEGWRWGANYRIETITDRFRPGAQNGTQFLDFEHVTPRHVANLNLGWAARRWEVDGYLHYQSATLGIQPLSSGAASVLVPVNAYASVDARVAYRPSAWATLALSGQNLLHARQQQTSGPQIERRVLGTLTFDL